MMPHEFDYTCPVPGCTQSSPCNRCFRNIREINEGFRDALNIYQRKSRNEYFKRDDWKWVVSVPGKINEN